MIDRELMQQALDALEFIPACGSMIGHVAEMKRVAAVATLRDRLAQPEQEPVMFLNNQPLYITPPQRLWVGLTEEDKAGFWTADQMTIEEWDTLFNEIEEALKEKNT